MSTATAPLIPADALDETEVERRTRLRPLAPPVRRRPRLLYALIAVIGAVLIGAAQMGMSIAMSQSGYEERALMNELRALEWDRQTVADDLAGLSSPQYLSANASALGMVIADAPNFVRLSDGVILGEGEAAGGASSVDAINRGSVPNALVADAPLVTEPDATIQGIPEPPPPIYDLEDPSLPPALSDGLPSPDTH